MRLFGLMITEDAPSHGGPLSTITSYGTRKTPKHYTFNFDEMDRIPYMAPDLVSKAKAARGKTPTDVWWHTIVSTQWK